jgi:beta-glucosidase
MHTEITQDNNYPFRDARLPDDERIDNLLSLMTIDEKVECLGTNPSVPRLGLAATAHSEGLHGLAMGGPGGWGRQNPIPTTTFQQAYGLGETWDIDAIETAARIEGYEARWIAQSKPYLRSQLVVRAPNADLGRDPRWGRTEECFGEDAFFNGTMVQAFVRGLQGDHPTRWLAASLMKHFLANSNEDERESSSSDFDERLFREYYSVPFRMGIEAGSRAFMAAYNAYNGVPCVVHPILKAIAVEEWGQDGIICTDGGAMKLLVNAHKYRETFEESCAAIVKAGVGQFLDDWRAATKKAVEDALLSEADIDAVLRGTFRVMIKLGLLDPEDEAPFASVRGAREPWLSQEHRDAARQIARKGIVLLKNDDALLPLDSARLKSIALVGRSASAVFFDWYSGWPAYAISPLDGIGARLGSDVEVRYTNGFDPADAVALAKESDAVVICVGNHPLGDAGWAKVTLPEYGKEARDRQSIDLADEELIRAVHAVNPKTIVVLISSFPYAIEWTRENVPAILHMTHNSQEEGNALADVLFGDFNPAGRLVQTWVRSLSDLPPRLDYDIRKGRTYMYFAGEPLYPFGFGLSYTTFAYADLRLSADKIEAGGEIEVGLSVTNTGDRDGEEVVQLYAEYLDSDVDRPRRHLVGFRRVGIAAGETADVALTVRADQFAYWNSADHGFELERGKKIALIAGRSSADRALEAVLTTA